jgi:hypothetical protein
VPSTLSQIPLSVSTEVFTELFCDGFYKLQRYPVTIRVLRKSDLPAEVWYGSEQRFTEPLNCLTQVVCEPRRVHGG